VHPKGDNILVGGYDRKVVWYDLDLGTSPYKMMKYHEKAVRKVAYHHKYPLFATCSDDCIIILFYGRQCAYFPWKCIYWSDAECFDRAFEGFERTQVCIRDRSAGYW